MLWNCEERGRRRKWSTTGQPCRTPVLQGSQEKVMWQGEVKAAT